MASLKNIPTLRRPRGLAARAVLFTTGLLAVSAILTAATVLYGADRESARHQVRIMMERTIALSTGTSNLLQTGDMAALERMVHGSATRTDVRRMMVVDARGEVIVAAKGTSEDIAAVNALAADVLASRQPEFSRADGVIATGVPVMRGDQFAGAALILWPDTAYHFDAISALAPFLLILACLALAAIPLTAHFVRRVMAPLDDLAQFAERVGLQGERAAPLDVRTGDEFETLAGAFNTMLERLDASMRRIQEIAFVDPATQLPNQERFVREVDFFILQSSGNNETGGVAVFELQRLPKLLQTLEPDAARDFLRVVAERLTSAVRTVDRMVRLRGNAGERPAIAARLSAIEFAVFVPGLASGADAARFAQHLNAALSQPFDWRGHKLTLGACCGVALAPRDGRDADTVIRHARMAMAAAHAAPARLKVFTQSLDREAVARLSLEREMRGALERNEFRAYFQPKIDLKSGRIAGCEALARWVRPDRTIISPGRFIPVAEESGLIGQLSDAIMREACWKAASWARAGHVANVAVNVSALQFRSDKFAENVLRIVQHAGLRPSQLELEITESVVMEDPERALRMIQPLRDAGVRLAIDDFGVGHSSLAALSKLPFDVIKIDQQFVRALERGDPQAAAIIDMILALAKTLDLEVVAEGVERRDEVEFVAARGCHWVQGFLYGAAVSAPEFAELLRRQAGEDVVSIDAA